MVEVPELPLSAIREAVANALVHRDLGPNTLGAGTSIDVRLLPDKMVISSPGGLRDLTVEQLKSRDLARQEINQRLYRLCRYLKADDGSFVIEGEGGGVQLMLDAAQEQGLPETDLIDSGVQFTVRCGDLTRVGRPALGSRYARRNHVLTLTDAWIPQ